jgi:hypothetical protein
MFFNLYYMSSILRQDDADTCPRLQVTLAPTACLARSAVSIQDGVASFSAIRCALPTPDRDDVGTCLHVWVTWVVTARPARSDVSV